MEVYDYEMKPDETEFTTYVSHFDFTLNFLKRHINQYMSCYNGEFECGRVKLSSYRLSYEFQFIDYIYGGCDISTMVGIDCSLANGHPSKKSSLHYLPPDQLRGDDASSIGGVTSRTAKSRVTDKMANLNRLIREARGIAGKHETEYVDEMNEYQEALYLCMSALEAYDNDKQIPFLGFGAKLPPFGTVSSSCFAMNGSIFAPESEGVEGLLNDYVKGMRRITPHGPSAHAKTIEYVVDYTKIQKVSQDN